MKISNPEYLEKVGRLSDEEQERLLSRMAGKLPRRLEKDKLSREEAMAIQMELEDEQLHEWRERMHAMKDKASKAEKTTKSKDKAGDGETKAAKSEKSGEAESKSVEAKPVKKAAPAKTVAAKTTKK